MNLIDFMVELANQLPSEECNNLKKVDENIQIALSQKKYTNERAVTVY